MEFAWCLLCAYRGRDPLCLCCALFAMLHLPSMPCRHTVFAWMLCALSMLCVPSKACSSDSHSSPPAPLQQAPVLQLLAGGSWVQACQRLQAAGGGGAWARGWPG